MQLQPDVPDHAPPPTHRAQRRPPFVALELTLAITIDAPDTSADRRAAWPTTPAAGWSAVGCPS
jgi:hypothetical protein